jgi:Cation efflux family
VRGAYLEMLGDLVGSGAVIIAAIMIALTGWTRFDAIASLAIFVLIGPRAWAPLREVVDVLLDATCAASTWTRCATTLSACRRLWTSTMCTPGRSQRRPGAVRARDRRQALHRRGTEGEVLDRLAECLGGHFDVGVERGLARKPSRRLHLDVPADSALAQQLTVLVRQLARDVDAGVHRRVVHVHRATTEAGKV